MAKNIERIINEPSENKKEWEKESAQLGNLFAENLVNHYPRAVIDAIEKMERLSKN